MQSGRLAECGRSQTIPASMHLRYATAAAHAEVETAFAAFMAAPARHLTEFLSAQHAAACALMRARSGPVLPEEGDLLEEFARELEAEIPAGRILTVTSPRPLCAEATAYLALGSRLGAEVIKRRLAEAGLPCPRAFEPTPPSLEWRAFRARIDRLDPDSRAFHRIVRDANAGFSVFATAAHAAFRAPMKEAV
ncbi:hypothetical protein FIU91_12935 [Roseivivax sp. THAF30]|nr:hypothetical protein FIU91_12935 [Roseivivax sp. THAF30]